jgi:hypothetical protein
MPAPGSKTTISDSKMASASQTPRTIAAVIDACRARPVRNGTTKKLSNEEMRFTRRNIRARNPAIHPPDLVEGELSLLSSILIFSATLSAVQTARCAAGPQKPRRRQQSPMQAATVPARHKETPPEIRSGHPRNHPPLRPRHPRPWRKFR